MEESAIIDIIDEGVIEREILQREENNSRGNQIQYGVFSSDYSMKNSLYDEEDATEASYLNPKRHSSNNNNNHHHHNPDPNDSDYDHNDNDDEHHESLLTKYSTLHWKHRPSTRILACASMISFLALGILIAPKINLIINLVCKRYYDQTEIIDPISGLRISIAIESLLTGNNDSNNNNGNQELCMIAPVQALTSRFQLCSQLINGIICTLTVARLGSLSDRIGRKPLMIWAGSCSFMAELVTVMCATFPSVFKYQWLLFGSFLDGLGGSMTIMMALNNAYATDCTSQRDRAKVFGTFHASMFFGIGFGPMLGSLLLKQINSLTFVLYFGLSMYVVYLILIIFLVFESRTEYQRRRSTHMYNTSMLKRQQRLSTINQEFILRRYDSNGPCFSWSYYWYIIRHDINIFKPLKILVFTHLPWRSRINAWTLVMIDGLFNGIGVGMGMVLILYAELQFGWGSVEAGYFVSVIGLSRVFTVGILLPGYLKLLNSYLSSRHDSVDSVDLVVIRGSLVIETIGLFCYAMAANSKEFVLTCLCLSMSAIVSPVVQSCLVKHVPKSNAGALLGALGLFHSLTKIAAPTIFLAIYSRTVSFRPNMVFLIASATFASILFFSSISLDRNATIKLESVDDEYAAGDDVVDTSESSDSG